MSVTFITEKHSNASRYIELYNHTANISKCCQSVRKNPICGGLNFMKKEYNDPFYLFSDLKYLSQSNIE